MILTIRTYGDPVLRKVSEPVGKIGPAERMLIASMLETMYKHKGVGLAAPQIGINKRIFVTDDGEGPEVFINVKITKPKGKAVLEEGCLSIPGINIDVERPNEITVEYIDHEGKSHKKIFRELIARVIQHETDHLNGKLIVDYLPPEELKKYQAKLEKIKNKDTHANT